MPQLGDAVIFLRIRLCIPGIDNSVLFGKN